MRSKSRSDKFRSALAARLTEAIDRHLGVSVRVLARRLGYANPTTIYAARRGTAFLDAERIARLATVETQGGEVIDLHWLITGQGTPLRVPGRREGQKAMRRRLIALMLGVPESDMHCLLRLLERGTFSVRRERRGKHVRRSVSVR